MLIQKCLGCYSHPFFELAHHFPTKHPLSVPAPLSLVQSSPIISGSNFLFFPILSFLSFLILSPHLGSVGFFFFIILANPLHPCCSPSSTSLFMSSASPPNAFKVLFLPTLPCTTLSKNLKLLIPPLHNLVPCTSQPAIPWVAVVASGSESEA